MLLPLLCRRCPPAGAALPGSPSLRGSKEPWLLLAMGSRRLWVLSRVAGMWDCHEGLLRGL